MAGWRTAGAIATLFDQFNARYPGRARTSDGTIGDAKHRSRNSDHNAWYGPGVVTAGDFTHDPRVGMDIDRLTNELVRIRDPRIKYLIANDLICNGSRGPSPWVWREYNGPNPHTKHFHLSVLPAPLCDDRSHWRLPSLAGHLPPPSPVRPPPPVGPGLRLGSKGAQVTLLQIVLNKWYRRMTPLVTDGDYGKATEARVKFFQSAAGLVKDGVAGPATLSKLGIK